MLTRRGFLVGAGLGVGALGAAAVVGDHVLADHGIDARAELELRLGLGDVKKASFASRYRRTDVTWMTAVPDGHDAAGLPMVLALHGRGGSARDTFTSMRADHALDDYVKGGGTAFAIVSVDGGDHSYWHPRADGTNALRMLTDELLPRAKELGLRTDRIGTIGWSMGGFGSLMLARESAQDRLDGTTVVASAASAPALWPSAGQTAAGAFDSAADFARWGDLMTQPGIEGKVPLRVDVGDVDPFVTSVRAYRAEVKPTPAGGIVSGGHSNTVWRPLVGAQLAFLGAHLRDT